MPDIVVDDDGYIHSFVIKHAYTRPGDFARFYGEKSNTSLPVGVDYYNADLNFVRGEQSQAGDVTVTAGNAEIRDIHVAEIGTPFAGQHPAYTAALPVGVNYKLEENTALGSVFWTTKTSGGSISLMPQIMAGIDATHFGPQNDCTRAQVGTFLYAATGKPEFEMPEATFSDVTESDWFYKPVMWAVKHGITSGIGDGKFGPGNTCTRAQIVTFLWAAEGRP